MQTMSWRFRDDRWRRMTLPRRGVAQSPPNARNRSICSGVTLSWGMWHTRVSVGITTDVETRSVSFLDHEKLKISLGTRRAFKNYVIIASFFPVLLGLLLSVMVIRNLEILSGMKNFLRATIKKKGGKEKKDIASIASRCLKFVFKK